MKMNGGAMGMEEGENGSQEVLGNQFGGRGWLGSTRQIVENDGIQERWGSDASGMKIFSQ